MNNIFKSGICLTLVVSLISVDVSAATLPNVDQGDYYGTSHALFLENFPAEDYNFSENTAAVKNIVSDDTELGYQGYPVNLNHNILTDSDDSVFLYNGDNSYELNSAEFKAMIEGLSESSKANIDDFINDISNEVGTLGSSAGFNGSSSYNYSSDGDGDAFTMGDIGNRVGNLFSSASK